MKLKNVYTGNLNGGFVMAYIDSNPKSKAQVKRDIVAGKKMRVFDPGIGLEDIPNNGYADVCGPHFPKPHRWYGRVKIENGFITSIK